MAGRAEGVDCLLQTFCSYLNVMSANLRERGSGFRVKQISFDTQATLPTPSNSF